MDIDLSTFCSSEEGRYDFRKPWSGVNHTYASNGHILIRTPKNGAPENLEYEKKLITDSKMGEALNSGSPSLACFEVSPLLPPAGKCKFCNGDGEAFTMQCPECEGAGEVDLENDFHTYEAECKSCLGDGWLRGGNEKRRCSMCYGSGYESPDRFAGIVIGDAKFNINLLRLIAKLPEAKIIPRGASHPALVVFDGGDGLVMPMS